MGKRYSNQNKSGMRVVLASPGWGDSVGASCTANGNKPLVGRHYVDTEGAEFMHNLRVRLSMLAGICRVPFMWMAVALQHVVPLSLQY